MKTKVIIFFWVITFSAKGDSWTKKADFIGAIGDKFTCFSLGNKGYIGTGDSNNGNPVVLSNAFWEYNQATNVWAQKADFAGTARIWTAGFGIENKGYIGLGYQNNNVFKIDFWEYDTASNAWTQKADFVGGGRHGATGFSINKKGYVGLGYIDSLYGYTKDFWEYDPSTDSWSRVADFGGVAREFAVGFSIGDKGYIGTGGGIGNPFVSKDFWEYDPINNSWTQKADFGGSPRMAATGFSIRNRGYIGTGYTRNGNFPVSLNDFWEYNPASNTWIQKSNFGGAPRSSAAGFSIGDKGYIGIGGSLLKDFWEYSPDSIIGVSEFENRRITIVIYPNPTTGSFTLSFNEPVQDAEVRVFNTLGEEVYEAAADKRGIASPATQAGASFAMTINLGRVPAGIYFVQVQDGVKQWVQKVVVE